MKKFLAIFLLTIGTAVFGGISISPYFSNVNYAVAASTSNTSRTIQVQYVDENGTPIINSNTQNQTIGYQITAPEYLLDKSFKLKSSPYIVSNQFNQRAVFVYSPVDKTPLVTAQSAKYLSVITQAYNSSVNSAYLKIGVSDDGVNWKTLSTNYPNTQVRDPSIIKSKNRYYIINTNGLFYTTDFKKWHFLKDPLNEDNGAALGKNNSTHTTIWAPEFVKDNQSGKYYVVYCANEAGGFDKPYSLYLADFDTKTGKISNWNQPLKGLQNADLIDPNITYDESSNYYYLWVRKTEMINGETAHTLKLYKSKKIIGDWQEVPIDNNIINWNVPHINYEAPELLKTNKGWRLYSDPYNDTNNQLMPDASRTGSRDGMMYLDLSNNFKPTMKQWKPVTNSYKMRHFGIIQNDNNLWDTIVNVFRKIASWF